MATTQRKIEINYRLLHTRCNIEVVGSVPDMQVYQADKAEYTPDSVSYTHLTAKILADIVKNQWG